MTEGLSAVPGDRRVTFQKLGNLRESGHGPQVDRHRQLDPTDSCNPTTLINQHLDINELRCDGGIHSVTRVEGVVGVCRLR